MILGMRLELIHTLLLSYALYSIPLPMGTQKKKTHLHMQFKYWGQLHIHSKQQEHKSTNMTQLNPARWHLYCVYTN